MEPDTKAILVGVIFVGYTLAFALGLLVGFLCYS